MSRNLVVFDLDETLVHARTEPLSYSHEIEVIPYFVYLRPNLNELLDYCVKHFDLAVWSSSSEEYVQAICGHIFADRYPLKFAWSSKRCVRREDAQSNSYIYIKDLRKLARFGYTTEQITIVDDSPEKIRRQPRNLLHVEPFMGDQNDNDLVRVIKVLQDRNL